MRVEEVAWKQQLKQSIYSLKVLLLTESLNTIIKKMLYVYISSIYIQ